VPDSTRESVQKSTRLQYGSKQTSSELKEEDEPTEMSAKKTQQASLLGDRSVETWLSRIKSTSDEAAHNFVMKNKKDNFGAELLRVAEFYPHLDKLNTKALNMFRSVEKISDRQHKKEDLNQLKLKGITNNVLTSHGSRNRQIRKFFINSGEDIPSKFRHSVAEFNEP